jgi:probable poly-beta-1,6-N-acetyl-D-glucosamine export protein
LAKERTLINEMFFIRAAACLSVVLVHSITVTVMKYDLPLSTIDIFRTIQMIMMFATPTFILISEVLVANAYPSKTPKGFLRKRIKFILLPYIFMGTVYSLYPYIDIPFTMESFGEKWVSVVLKGQWHGYFILIIFQFYFLHFLFARYLNKIPGYIILPLAFIINAYYLGYFNFVPPHGENGYYIWYDLSRLPFLGWVFYFTLAYYCGINIKKFRSFLKKTKFIYLPLMIIGAYLVAANYHSGFIKMVWSNRVDVLVYTILIVFSLFYLASKFKKIPSIVLLLSKYSFGIYLLHPLFHKLLYRYSFELPYINMGLFLLMAFSLGAFGSILITFILNKLKVGQTTVGKVGMVPSSKQQQREQAA